MVFYFAPNLKVNNAAKAMVLDAQNIKENLHLVLIKIAVMKCYVCCFSNM